MDCSEFINDIMKFENEYVQKTEDGVQINFKSSQKSNRVYKYSSKGEM